MLGGGCLAVRRGLRSTSSIEADLDFVHDLILGHLTGDLEGELEHDLLLSGVLLGDLE